MSNAPKQSHLPDVASSKDDRGITIPKVGVRNLRMPCQVDGISDCAVPTVAVFSLTVSLQADARGTHMSRLVNIIDELCSVPVTMNSLKQAVQHAAQALSTNSAQITAAFPYFVCKKAPVSGQTGVLDIDMKWDCQLSSGEYLQRVTLIVPVQSLCPCSKEISAFGAHNQRCNVEVQLDLASDTCLFNIDQVISGIESCASSPLYTMLKREDERHITESAYNNPKFVEDILRELVIFFRTLQGITRYRIDVESIESIHNHSACAAIEEDLA